MSRILWKSVAQGVTTASIPVDAENERTRASAWHAFVSGTFNGTSVQVEYSPDTIDTPDANSTWYAPTALVFAAVGDTFFQARPRKFRLVLTGGGVSTSVNVEVRA